MNKLIQSLSLDELLAYYENTFVWQKRIETAPSENVCFAFGVKTVDEAIVQLAYDRSQLWLRMVDKIPASHILEIENIKAQLNMATTDSPKVPIESGQRWKHRHVPGMVIEVNGREENSYLWSVSQFNNSTVYSCPCYLTSLTIIKYFTRLNP